MFVGRARSNSAAIAFLELLDRFKLYTMAGENCAEF